MTSALRAAVVLDACAPLEVEQALGRVGGKSHTLGRLMRAGVRVPAGFVIATHAFEEHLDRAGVGTPAEAPSEVRALIAATPLADELRDEVFALASVLLERGPVVVRSSAVGEDSAAASFAGQLDSILHVASVAELEAAVLACWASFFSDRAVFYRRAKDVAAAGMGVIVQAQVDAAAAGVMFTRWEGGANALVEYTSGLGDQLVAGAVDPVRISIDRASGETATLGETTSDVDHLVRGAELLRVARQLEHDLGGPQDVEWAMTADGSLHVVQSRPITVSAKPRDARRQVVWTNANVNENFPDPISPLLYSVASAGYTHYFRNLGRAFGIAPERLRAMEPAFAQIIGVHGARMYYNLTNIHAVIRLAPFGDALASSFDAFVGVGDESPTVSSPARTRGRLRQAMEMGVIGMKVVRQYAFIERRIREFERTVDDFASRTEPARLGSLPATELGRLVGEFMDIRCNRWTNASLADTAAMVCYGALERVIALAYPDRGDAAHTSLLKAIPDVVSNEPVHQLWALSRLIRADAALMELVGRESATMVLERIREERFVAFRVAFERYLDQWGFRCSSELMLTVPSFQEEPAPVIDMLRAYAKLDADTPHETMARQAVEREGATARAMDVLRRMPLPYMRWLSWAAVFRVLLPWTHASIRYRERARLKQALLYGRLRRVALALGERLAGVSLVERADDAFWFTADELQALAAGSAMHPGAAKDLVAARVREHAVLVATTPPDSFTLAKGEYFDAARDKQVLRLTRNEGLLGITACAGRITGRARVLRDVSEAERLERGDVLVTKQTDPGWGPVFFLIAGLVIERGGMLSHGAILAREFGIPCVVGVKDATRVIPDGATITVDADGGCVHVEH